MGSRIRPGEVGERREVRWRVLRVRRWVEYLDWRTVLGY
jgi:hypothetical protein